MRRMPSVIVVFLAVMVAAAGEDRSEKTPTADELLARCAKAYREATTYYEVSTLEHAVRMGEKGSTLKLEIEFGLRKGRSAVVKMQRLPGGDLTVAIVEPKRAVTYVPSARQYSVNNRVNLAKLPEFIKSALITRLVALDDAEAELRKMTKSFGEPVADKVGDYEAWKVTAQREIGTANFWFSREKGVLLKLEFDDKWESQGVKNTQKVVATVSRVLVDEPLLDDKGKEVDFAKFDIPAGAAEVKGGK